MKIELLQLVQKTIKQHPNWSRRKIAKELKMSPGTVQYYLEKLVLPGALPPPEAPEIQIAKKTPAEFGRLDLKHIDSGDWVRLGLVADTHLGCQEARLDVLHAQYDLFEREGIRHVLHAGNLVDGFIPKINAASVFVLTPDDQAQYAIDNYPARRGIVTHFITGDDHEGWWIKQGLNWGVLLKHMANAQGRADLDYIGHVEADVEIKCPHAKKNPIIKVQHPGGGSCYARSYAPQRTVESFTGGEKPDILIQGHYHVSGYWNERNVHTITLPGMEDQTIFARKKRLRMEVGAALLEFKVNELGVITRCRCEFNMYFDRAYYRTFLRSDKKVLKGHLVISA
jgi:hypothetical protein